MPSTPRARDLLAPQFPHLALGTVEELAYGFDNTVLLVDGTWAVRFPRRQMGADLVGKELDLLPLLAPRLPVPVPVPALIGRPADGYPWPFWGARLIAGTEVADAGLPEEGRPLLAAGIGAFLRVLHDPELAREHGAGLPRDPMRRALPAARGPVGRESLDRLATLGHWQARSPVDAAYDALVRRGSRLGPPHGEPVLVHGDLHLRHVLVGPDGAPTGVIDWGDACLADPAVDLAFGYAALSGPDREAFFAAYGARPDPERELRARVLAAALCAVLADYALSVGRSTLLTESLAGVARSVS